MLFSVGLMRICGGSVWITIAQYNKRRAKAESERGTRATRDRKTWVEVVLQVVVCLLVHGYARMTSIYMVGTRRVRIEKVEGREVRTRRSSSGGRGCLSSQGAKRRGQSLRRDQ
jgi:hypothetical protein